MQRFRQMRSSQKIVTVHASVHSHFKQESALYSRDKFKLNRSTTLAVWHGLCAAHGQTPYESLRDKLQ